MFRVGQKCICVNVGEHPAYPGLGFEDGGAPVLGATYTVARVLNDFGQEVLHFVEIKRGPTAVHFWGDDVGYGAWRFRPIVERKTDISVFEEILRWESAPSSLPLAEA